MGVFDRFKGGGGRGGRRGERSGARERGVRSGGRKTRRSGDRTEALPIPSGADPRSSVPPPPPHARSSKTEVHQVQAPQQAPPARGPAPPPQPIPPPQPGGGGDAEKTRIAGVATTSTSVVGVLVAIEGELQGQSFVLGDGENTIGRAPGCRVVLPSEWISREHARVIHMEGQFVVGPISDRNPTLLNDSPTTGAELKDGDTLRLGKTTLRFRTV